MLKSKYTENSSRLVKIADIRSIHKVDIKMSRAVITNQVANSFYITTLL